VKLAHLVGFIQRKNIQFLLCLEYGERTKSRDPVILIQIMAFILRILKRM